MTDRPSWNMARIASNRPLPKPRAKSGPVGESTYHDDNYDERFSLDARKCCGYHVCKCEVTKDVAFKRVGSTDLIMPNAKPGEAFFMKLQAKACEQLAYRPSTGLAAAPPIRTVQFQPPAFPVHSQTFHEWRWKP